MAIGRWVVVDQPTRTILGGPYLWNDADPNAAGWQPPEGGGRAAAEMAETGDLREESAALAAGYAFPPPPDEPWVVIDPATMLIVAGPEAWNGQGNAPLSTTGEQQLMRETDAQSQGYSYP